MFRKIISTVTVLFLLSSFVFAQDFEGRITFNVSTSQTQQPQTMKYYLKDKLVRMEVSQMPGYILVKDSMMTVVMPMQKMFMQMSMKSNKQIQASPDEFLKDTKPHVTGNTKEILGYKCEEYVVKDSNGTATVWGTEEFTNFPGFDGSGKDAFAEALGKKNFFPMIIEADQKGVHVKMEVTEIKPEKLNENLFKIPEGYKKIDMPGM